MRKIFLSCSVVCGPHPEPAQEDLLRVLNERLLFADKKDDVIPTRVLLANAVHTGRSLPDTSTTTKRLGAKCQSGIIWRILANMLHVFLFFLKYVLLCFYFVYFWLAFVSAITFKGNWHMDPLNMIEVMQHIYSMPCCVHLEVLHAVFICFDL